MEESRPGPKKSRKRLMFVLVTSLLAVSALLMVAVPTAHSQARPGLEPFLRRLTLIHTEVLPPADVVTSGGVRLRMTSPVIRVYTINRDYKEVLAAARLVLR